MEVLGSTETGGIAWRRRSLESDGTISTPPWKTVPGITAGVRLEDGRVLPEGEGLLALLPGATLTMKAGTTDLTAFA
ncbi:MAG: hypothetical protein V8T46_06835 [Sutterella seckii]